MLYTQNAKIILASGSPRRKQMLSDAGLAFTVEVSSVDETQYNNETPESLVHRLALSKANEIADQNAEAWIIGADTDVSIDGEILGKPASKESAFEILKKIQGRTHEVWGAFALVNKSKNIAKVEAFRSFVEMAPLDDAAINRYIETGEPMDKAGAYAVQGIGSQFIVSVNGSYTNVVGLNLSALIRTLLKLGVIS